MRCSVSPPPPPRRYSSTCRSPPHLRLAAFFPTAGHAAAWGVLIAGCLEVLLLAGDASRQGVLPVFRWPRLDQEMKLFFKRFGPATVGSSGTQIALFADTIIASFARHRRALGAVLCRPAQPASDRRHRHRGRHSAAAGDGAPDRRRRRGRARCHAQNRAIELTLILSVPCLRRVPDRPRPDHARACSCAAPSPQRTRRPPA